MSQTYSLVCHRTKKRVWIGQGWGALESFYSGMPETMAALHRFLADHVGEALYCLCDDTHEAIMEYEAYEDCEEEQQCRLREYPGEIHIHEGDSGQVRA